MISLIRILRLSIILNGQRNDSPRLKTRIEVIEKDHWKICGADSDWLDENKLLAADLLAEQELWSNIEWQLSFDENQKA